MIQYSGTVTIDGHAIDLPKGYKAYFLRIKGNDCDFKAINGVPCLISIRGVVDAQEVR